MTGEHPSFRIRPAKRVWGRVRRAGAGFGRSRRGNGTVEFVVLFPILFITFCVMLEMALMMSRYVIVERSVDQVVRLLRLGSMPSITAASVQSALQSGLCTVLEISDTCSKAITVELSRVDRTTFALPATNLPCVTTTSTGQVLVPVTQFVPGQLNDLMLIRVCVKVRSMTRASLLGLPANVIAKDGSYAIAVAAFFVVEPR